MELIRTEAEYEMILAKVKELFNSEPNTPEGKRLELLFSLIEDYEEKHHSIPMPDPISAISYYLETTETTRSEFSRLTGISSGRLSELLLKHRALSKDHIRMIHAATKIPLDVLLQDYELKRKQKRSPRQDNRPHASV